MHPDPYHDAALIGIVLICDECQATLESEELKDQPTYPQAGYDVALGDAARDRGWRIDYRGDDFSILCPAWASPPK